MTAAKESDCKCEGCKCKKELDKPSKSRVVYKHEARQLLADAGPDGKELAE